MDAVKDTMNDPFFKEPDRRKIKPGNAVCAYPITGLLCDDEELQLGYSQLLKFNYQEWWTVEKSGIVEDWLFEYMNNRPMWAYYSVPGVVANETTCVLVTNTLVETLRIFKKGYILEPEYTVRAKYESNGTSSRLPGIYRTKYIEAIWGEARQEECLKIFPDEYEEINARFFELLWLKQYFYPSIAGLLESFNVIHIPAVRPAFVVHSLMICFEMLFGSGQEYDKYNSYPNERALELLKRTGKNTPELEEYLLNDVHEYRNKIHHGTKVDSAELSRNRNYLEQIVRVGMQQYLDLMVRLHYDEAGPKPADPQDPQMTARTIFNKNLGK